ncbi:type IIL restriction-modification enzyme MmeI [Solidesulfovibrio sp.]|uniref:Eco57I restriction-modification methylase domain-containing protein n=1 Tax=Solidesulfovibrio sp. TaxID=2910990 RepID=UPI00260E4679|nr:type IIL restriction-modification enzyme MmeI [Solidesulfovibrio sp.]
MKVGKLSKHAEWLSLIEISGPFLTVSMLEKAFPQGLEAVETPRRQRLRAAYEEWREAVDQEDKLLPELHQEWVRLVLTELLEYDHESLIQAIDWPGELPSVSSHEHAGTFNPDWIVRSPADGRPRLFIAVLPPDTDLESVQRGDGWPVSLQERMTLLCRAQGVRLGLLTNGERWMLANAPMGSTSSQASWYARLWFQEPITLKAFQSLLGVRRCFGPAEDTLDSLLDESLKHHEEVTDTLGEQVRRAVEVLVQCLDKADEDRNRELLRDVKPAELYEAGLTVMMRLVFVLCAEERGLLLLGVSVYDRCYDVSTLRGHLEEEAYDHVPEVLDRRHDAWTRLLAVFRAVYGGIEHESLRMPALGGSLFDPDRFPFLEGRDKGSSWRDTSAAPLPIDNRTVLLLLNSLQILKQSGGALLLSYRALDVEQIGHVYEGLLEHTVARVPRVTLGLQGAQKAKNPNVALAELESALLDGEAALVKLVLDVTGRSESAIRNGLSKPAADTVFGRVLGGCGGDTALAERIRPFTNLLRTDAWDDPIVYRDNSFMVTLGADRRETGTHYTPKSLTESIVTTTLEPVVYAGPAEGKTREEWALKSSREILDLKVCDPAMGSGAFLVQACRYLGEKLVEAWLHEEATGKAITVDGEALDQLGAEEPLPSQLDERLTIARRLVAERCLYGVDVNPLAVELAKLSIWLVTLAKGRPFGFLDHNLRSGDSLLGLHELKQLTKLSLFPEKKKSISLFASNIEVAVKEALTLRKQLRQTTIRDISDVQYMELLNQQARQKLAHIEHVADAIVGEALASGGNQRKLEAAMDNLFSLVTTYIEGDNEAKKKIIAKARKSLSMDIPADRPTRKPFHWAVEFPEVFFDGRDGFDSVLGNPPFMAGTSISTVFGKKYKIFLKLVWPHLQSRCDLCVVFMLRGAILSRKRATMGYLGSNTAAQTDSRLSGSAYLLSKGWTIFAAQDSEKWPGAANVYICRIHYFKGMWQGCFTIGEKAVTGITSSLTEGGENPEPFPLHYSNIKSFTGTKVYGDGFILSAQEAEKILQRDSAYKKVIKPFLIGRELNEDPRCRPSRYVIDFTDMNEEEARRYETAWDIVERRVYPTRKISPEERMRKIWWQFQRPRAELYRRLDNDGIAWCVAATSDTVAFVALPISESKPLVISHAVNVLILNGYGEFAAIQSSIHNSWARFYGSTIKGDFRYTTTDCFYTFPFPGTPENLVDIGTQYHTIRGDIMSILNEGLTSIYRLFNDKEIQTTEINEIRNLHEAMDLQVVKSYGWSDINLEHGFYETAKGIRFTISENARREVLQRLLKLNHERYKDEVSHGLHSKGSKRITSRDKRTSPSKNAAQTQFSLTVETPTIKEAGETPVKTILGFMNGDSSWHSKAEIIAATGITDGQWTAAITALIASGRLERQGVKRGTRYRLIINAMQQGDQICPND